MSTLPGPPWPTRLERVGMSLDDYLALPERPKVEYADGEAIVTPPGSARSEQPSPPPDRPPTVGPWVT